MDSIDSLRLEENSHADHLATSESEVNHQSLLLGNVHKLGGELVIVWYSSI